MADIQATSYWSLKAMLLIFVFIVAKSRHYQYIYVCISLWKASLKVNHYSYKQEAQEAQEGQ